MRVRLLPADEAGCSYYRHEQPARVAREQHEVEAMIYRGDYTIYQAPFGKIVATAEPENGGTRITEWAEDVVVLQRPTKTTTVDMIPILQSRGVAVVVDVDDDFSCLHAQHPSRDHFNPSLNANNNWHNLRHACGIADLVTVTTDALAERYGAHGRVAVLRNCVPRSMLEREWGDTGRAVGWAGRAEMHPGDLEATRGGAAEALERAPGWRFVVIGPGDGARRGLSLREEPRASGGLEMEDYFRALADLDVGIVPLADSRFNAAKSGLKGLEYAARGVPFVASPLPEYQALAEEGIGVLAVDRARNWRNALVQLMRDESLRWETATHARAVIEERHTYETEGWRWCEAWGHALQTRRRLGHREAA